MNLDELLEECLSKIEQGASVAECIARYPDYAAELEPLLRLATMLSEATPRPMSDEAFVSGRRALAEAARYAATDRSVSYNRSRLNPLLRRMAEAAFYREPQPQKRNHPKSEPIVAQYQRRNTRSAWSMVGVSLALLFCFGIYIIGNSLHDQTEITTGNPTATLSPTSLATATLVQPMTATATFVTELDIQTTEAESAATDVITAQLTSEASFTATPNATQSPLSVDAPTTLFENSKTTEDNTLLTATSQPDPVQTLIPPQVPPVPQPLIGTPTSTIDNGTATAWPNNANTPDPASTNEAQGSGSLPQAPILTATDMPPLATPVIATPVMLATATATSAPPVS
jgi:hypothetical protein